MLRFAFVSAWAGFAATACLPLLTLGRVGAEEPQSLFNAEIRGLLAERCFACHGPDVQEAGLRLDQFDSATSELDSGTRAIVAGDSASSELLLRVTTKDSSLRMPPEGPTLSHPQIESLRKWIESGAAYDEHWAYSGLIESPPPNLGSSAWVRNPIDAFVLAKLQEQHIAPSEPADRRTLLRRAYYDLIGLPPEPTIVEAFVNDPNPNAFEKHIDQLLHSQHFGERWGRHWLDKARYADSDGYEKDRPRPNAWKYRDWVIEAINRDLPLDQFTIEQLAGDLLPNATDEQRLATAFHRQTLTNTEGGVDQEEFRVEAVFDRTETTGTIWLGLTVGCARCHTHKYDAITQDEYYKLFAFFNNGDESTIQLPRDEAEMRQYLADKTAHDLAVAELQRQLAAASNRSDNEYLAWQHSLQESLAQQGPSDDQTSADSIAPAAIREVLAVAAEKRTDKQAAQLREHFLRTAFKPTKQLYAQLEQLISNAPKSPLLDVRVISQPQSPRETHVYARGVFMDPLHTVQPGGLATLPPIQARNGGEPDRLDLARWLVSEHNPLPARVLGNHVWSHLFGEGIVRTMNDFGVRGQAPTHRLLLDWLAAEYRRVGWSRKRLIKTIMLSSTYQQASQHRPELLEVDAENRLLARQNRFRVQAEIVRDLALSVSGLLCTKIGGPSVFPPLPADVAALSYANSFKWTTSTGEDRLRRGMYTFFKRTAPHPNLITFDCPDSNTTTVARRISNTPLQALTLLNNEVFVEAARSLASRIQRLDSADEQSRVDAMLQLCLSRSATNLERERLIELLNVSRDWYRQHPEAARQLGDYGPSTGTEMHENSQSGTTVHPSYLLSATEQTASEAAIEAASWTAVARIVLNLDEFVTRE